MKVRFSLIYQMAGAFIVLAILILITGTFFIIKEKKLFVKMETRYTFLNRGEGISPATKVILKGIEVGYVRSVYLAKNDKIRVDMELYPEYTARLKGFTYIKVASGSFIGGKQLEIVPEEKSLDIFTNQFIPSEDEDEIKKLLEKGKIKIDEADMNKKMLLILDDVNVIVKNVKKMTNDLQSPNSDVMVMIGNLRRITASVAQMSEALAKNSPEMSKMVQDSQETLAEVKGMIRQAKQGSLYRMITPEVKLPSSDQRLIQMDTRDF